MAVTVTPRIGVTQWSVGADPFTRGQMEAAFANVELYAARDEQGLVAARPAPGLRGRWYFATDTRKHLYRDDGATLHEVPLIGQQNDYTAVSTVALAAESVTQSSATKAPAGVTRATATGHRSYFALIKSGVVDWAVGVGGTVADGSGEVNPLIAGAPDGSMGIPTPLFYFGTAGTFRAVGALSYFGPYAAGTAGTTRVAAGQYDANNASVSAQGANANVGLILQAQGTASITAMPTPGVAVLTIAPTLITAAQRVAVTAGGFDVAGSPSGYSGGEVRFPVTTAAAIQGLSTLATGAPRMQFDHRGAGNTGDFRWGNGTNGGATQMLLSGAGVLAAAGGVTASAGNVTAAAGNVTAAGGYLGTVGVGGVARLYMKATDSALDAKVWDFSPVGNTMVARILNDAESSSATWMTVTRSATTAVTSVLFAAKVTASQVGTPAGPGTTAGAVAFGDNDAHTWEGSGTGQWIFRNAGNGANASFRFFGGVGGVELASFDGTGNILAVGTANKFGRGAFGGTGVALTLSEDGTNTFISPAGTTADVDLILRPKGTTSGAIRLQAAGGGNMLTVAVGGHLLTGNGAAGAATGTFNSTGYVSVSVNGTDVSGTIALNAGGAPGTIGAGNSLGGVRFATSWSGGPRSVVLTPMDARAAALMPTMYASISGANGFDLITVNAYTPPAGLSAMWSYHVLG